MSNYNDLLTNTQGTIQALNFTWGVDAQTVSVEIAAQPLNRESVDPTLPTIFVCPGLPETSEPAATGGLQDVSYRVEITILAPGNASFETNLPVYLGWRESLRLAFQRVHYSSVPGYWGVRVKPMDVLNRDLQRDNYDFSILEIEYLVLEKASN